MEYGILIRKCLSEDGTVRFDASQSHFLQGAHDGTVEVAGGVRWKRRVKCRNDRLRRSFSGF